MLLNKKRSETFHDMLMHVSCIQNSNKLTSRAYKTMLFETIVDRDIGAQETCHFLLELHLSECSRQFIVLNVGMKVFKQVQDDTYYADNDSSQVLMHILSDMCIWSTLH